MIKAYAESKGVVQGDTRGTVVRGADQRRIINGRTGRPETMSDYYNRVGTSMLGKSARSRGTAANVRYVQPPKYDENGNKIKKK